MIPTLQIGGVGLRIKQGAGGGGGGVTAIIWNSADKAAYVALDEADKVAYNTGGVAWGSARSTTSFTTGSGGSLTFEVEVRSSQNVIVGFMNASATLSSFVGGDGNGYGYYASNGNKAFGGGLVTYGATLTTGDKFQATIYSNGDVEFFKNGVSQGLAFTGLSGTFYPAVSVFDAAPSNGAEAT